MPRKSPDGVQEVRLTMGNFERAKLDNYLNALERQATVETIASSAEAAVKVAAACGMGWLALQTYLLINPPDDAYVNPTGGNIWAALRLRAGSITREQYEAEVQKNTEKARKNKGSEPAGFWDWVIFGNDGKFFGFG